MDDLKNKVAVITGAGSGIGRALALRLAEEGCGLGIVDLDGGGLTETRGLLSKYPQRVVPYVVDVGNKEQMFSLAESVAREQGGADLLINNAGISGTVSFLDVPLDVMERFMQVNFWSVVYGCKAFLPQLLAKPIAHIVNVSSIEGMIALPSMIAYTSSKFAIRGFTEVLKLDLRRTQVGVSCVFPGGVKTNIARNAVRLAKKYLEEHPELALQMGPQLEKADGLVAAFEAHAGTSAEEAASVIVEGIKGNRWRILIGQDAASLDELQRSHPEDYPEILSKIWPKGLGPEW
jgi:NAD(P)-dependent dehydrogenase (short-subunit alcohol dehydrogenase family)